MFANNFGGQNNICCGLVCEGKRPIPLKSVDVRASVVHAVALVEITQNYVNKEEQPIEAIYYFPVDPDGSVTNFQAELDGRVIKGAVKPRDEALKVYAEAITNKKTSFLGEETKIDIFKLRVGFLKPGAQVKIIIEYITEVKNEPGTNNIRFYLPTTIAPRYVSSTEKFSQANDIQNMEFSASSPAPLSIAVTISIQCGIKVIESPTHQVTVQKLEPFSETDNCHKVIVELSGQTTDMDRDFVLTIEPEEKHILALYSETNGNDNSTAVMVHLLPSFKLCELKAELIFVLDRSGSMKGKSIAMAKEALLLFLHSMPADCYFNVVGFGSKYASLFPTSVKYDDKSLKKAKTHAKSLDADMGGTEILAPLEEIFGQPLVDGYLRQIFVLTDGQVSSTDAVVGIVHANAHKVRVFALGIGDSVSHGLVGGIAKAGGGTATYVTYNETIDKKVLDQLKNALQPSLTEIHLEWEGLSPVQEQQATVLNKMKTLLGYNKPIELDIVSSSDSSPSIKQSPERIPPVFDGSQLLVFGLFRNDSPKSVLITAQSPDGPLTVRVEHSPSNNLDGDARLLLHRLAAIKLIRELEAKEDWEPRKSSKQEIIEIACQNGITSRYTSFIAIDVNDDKQSMMENWVMETRYVPSQLAHGWHGIVQFTDAHAVLRTLHTLCDEGQYVMKTSIEQVSERADCLQSSHFAIKNRSSKSWFPSTFNIKSKIQSIAKNFFIQPNHNDAKNESSSDADAEDGADASSSLLMRLINLQSFDGSFTLDEKLSPILGKSLMEMIAVTNEHGLTSQVFATALAISFLVNNLAEEKEKWDLIVAKARKWLNATVQPDNVDRIIKLSTDFLKSL